MKTVPSKTTNTWISYQTRNVFCELFYSDSFTMKLCITFRYYGGKNTTPFKNTNGTILSNFNHYNAKMVALKGHPFVVGSGSIDFFSVFPRGQKTIADQEFYHVQTEMFDRDDQSWKVLQPFPAATE